MRCFFVFTRQDSGLREETVKEKFSKHYVISPGSVWVVAASDHAATTKDVCDTLGVGSENEITALVIELSRFNGYFDRALWESLKNWESSP